MRFPIDTSSLLNALNISRSHFQKVSLLAGLPGYRLKGARNPATLRNYGISRSPVADYVSGANVNGRDWGGAPALVAAMSFPPILDMLLSRGADCQVVFMLPKRNPIEWAIESGNVALV